MSAPTSAGGRSGLGDPWAILLGLFALGNLANAVWMLADPTHWYLNLPANVPGSGPLNEHFVRDIGCIFLLIGLGLALGAVRPAARLAALLVATGFYGLHSAVHVYDTWRGLFGPEQWRIDLVPVYAATLLLAGVSVAWARSRPGGRT